MEQEGWKVLPQRKLAVGPAGLVWVDQLAWHYKDLNAHHFARQTCTYSQVEQKHVSSIHSLRDVHSGSPIEI